MRIAIVSDTHSRTATVEQTLALIAGRGIEMILHCGDLEDADTARLFPAHTDFVFGNCDQDRDGIRAAIAEIGGRLHEPFGHVEIDGKNIAFLHGDNQQLLRELIAAEAFDYLLHGHTHARRDERIGPTRIINPGALHRARPKTFAILDVATGDMDSVIVE